MAKGIMGVKKLVNPIKSITHDALNLLAKSTSRNLMKEIQNTQYLSKAKIYSQHIIVSI